VERRFYALRIAYDGGAFRGFQRQPGLASVQASLEEALLRAGVRAPLAVAARTDAGVHAVGQVVSFAARADLDPDALRRTVNAALPEGLLALDAYRVRPSFHARNTATGRRYVYLVGAPPPEPLRRYAWSLPDLRAFPDGAAALDPDRMRAALALAVGRHDFVGFARPGEQRGTVRTVTRADVLSAAFGPLHALVFEGQGFLRAMIRNLVGTAVAVGLGRAEPGVVRELIDGRARYRGVRAPGHGLTLAEVCYPAGALPLPGSGPPR
jgi:tRNA pseudouridine38-40 synthase